MILDDVSSANIMGEIMTNKITVRGRTSVGRPVDLEVLAAAKIIVLVNSLSSWLSSAISRSRTRLRTGR